MTGSITFRGEPPLTRIVHVRYRRPPWTGLHRAIDEFRAAARRARLQRQQLDAMTPRPVPRPALPVLAPAPSWDQCVRAWLRQPVRLKKGARQSG